MKPNESFLNLPKTFWASVRLISQQVGYTDRKTGRIKIPSTTDIGQKLTQFDIDTDRLQNQSVGSHKYAFLLQQYFEYRAEIIYSFVKSHLMDVAKAKTVFENHFNKLNPKCPLPVNKQKGEKKTYAYLTCLVNMLVEANAQGVSCDYDPHHLTTITKNGLPVRTLARRVDGAFPSSLNPIAIWEIKEYYYTTTFGSRVADGVYETLLDGLELEELLEHEKINVLHYLIIDAYDTWWNKGKSYLCRIIDLLHMGLIDEVLVGYEVVERLPSLVSKWVDQMVK